MNPAELEIRYDPLLPHGKKFSACDPETGDVQAISESEAQLILLSQIAAGQAYAKH